ncbi:MAG TPA: D-alanyl-D-alanine carboxypeptidase, partial [Candidatus Enterococcus avicola]|nr:D-alanyl-D-alanine carboxypeptidase [Candidatus Enterococcus avicola]
FLSLILLLPGQTSSFAATKENNNFSVEAKAALAFDFETGKILYEKNSEEKLEIASLTKLISLYVVQTKIASGELAWDTPVTISKAVSELSLSPELSNIPLIEGQNYSVKELFDAATIVSANAATVALAEKVAGTEFAFVDLMKEQLIAWGIENPLIVNASGLNNEDIPGEIYPGSARTDENKLTAKELALVSRNLIRDFPETLQVTSQSVLNYTNLDNEESIMYTTNLLLPGMPYAKAGVDGLKTGTTDLAGRSLITTMKKDNQRVITILLNATDQEDPDARYTETSRLLDYAFGSWESKAVVTKGQMIPTVEPIPVEKSLEGSVDLIAQDTIELFLPIKEDLNTVDFKLDYLDNQALLIAPVEANQAVAKLTVTYPQDTLGYLEPVEALTTILVTKSSVEKANFFQLTWQKIQQFFSKR